MNNNKIKAVTFFVLLVVTILISSCAADRTDRINEMYAEYESPFKGAECGLYCIEGVCSDLGECEGYKKYCGDNMCKDACVDMDCGTDNGWDCGHCEEDWLCGNNNVCYNPCSGKECGESEGVICEECNNGYLCEENHCVDSFPNHHNGSDWSEKASSIMTHDYAISYCEQLGGHLPTISQLRGLIQNCPVTVTGGACGVTDSCLSLNCWDSACGGCGGSGSYSVFGDTGYLWSSSVQSDGVYYAWMVGFDNGEIFSRNRDSYYYDVRCVR